MDMQTILANTWSHADWFVRVAMIGLGASALGCAVEGLGNIATAAGKLARDLINAGRLTAAATGKGLMALPLGRMNLRGRAVVLAITGAAAGSAVLGALGY